jgi:hypothetical protein
MIAFIIFSSFIYVISIYDLVVKVIFNPNDVLIDSNLIIGINLFLLILLIVILIILLVILFIILFIILLAIFNVIVITHVDLFHSLINFNSFIDFESFIQAIIIISFLKLRIFVALFVNLYYQHFHFIIMKFHLCHQVYHQIYFNFNEYHHVRLNANPI